MSDSRKHYFKSKDIQMLQTGRFADGTVKCQGRSWKVHRVLLATRLKFFEDAFFNSSLESTAKEVNFPDHDPESVNIMLRHLYREELDVQHLNTPALCVRCWKLADYVQMDSLKSKAISSLGQHLDAMALLACNNGHQVREYDSQSGFSSYISRPKWLNYLLDAFREVCLHEVTEPLQSTFAAFLWVTRFELFRIREVMDSLNHYHGLNERVHKLSLSDRFYFPMKLPAWLSFDKTGSFGKTGDILERIKERVSIEFPDGGYCSRCQYSSPEYELLYCNPFPVEDKEIGDLIWCHECMATFNEECSWPWRNGSGRSRENRIRVEAWSW